MIARIIQVKQDLSHLNIEDCGLSYGELLYITLILINNTSIKGIHMGLNKMTYEQKLFIINVLNHDNEYQYISPHEKE